LRLGAIGIGTEAHRLLRSLRCRGSDLVGPDVKVNYAAYDTQAGEADCNEGGQRIRCRVVVIGNDPTCGPDELQRVVRHADGRRRHHTSLHGWQATGPRRPRPRERIDLAPGADREAASSSRIRRPLYCVISQSSAINWTERECFPPSWTMTHSSQDEGTRWRRCSSADYNPGGHLVSTWPKVARSAPAKHGLQHTRRLHVHCTQGRAAVSV